MDPELKIITDELYNKFSSYANATMEKRAIEVDQGARETAWNDVFAEIKRIASMKVTAENKKDVAVLLTTVTQIRAGITSPQPDRFPSMKNINQETGAHHYTNEKFAALMIMCYSIRADENLDKMRQAMTNLYIVESAKV